MSDIDDSKAAIQEQVHLLLINLHYFLNRIDAARCRRDQLTDEQKLGEVVFLEAMEREIIMGLCRLDEDGSDKVSFRGLKKEILGQPCDAGTQKHLTDKVAEYRDSINNVKQQCRNKYIAHLSKRFDGYMDDHPDLKPLVKNATELCDLLSGKKKQYLLKFKDTPEPLDLRRVLGMLPPGIK